MPGRTLSIELLCCGHVFTFTRLIHIRSHIRFATNLALIMGSRVSPNFHSSRPYRNITTINSPGSEIRGALTDHKFDS